jgi:hypothetical protein
MIPQPSVDAVPIRSPRTTPIITNVDEEREAKTIVTIL